MLERLALAGRAGFQLLTDGAEGLLRLGKEGQLIVGEGQAKLYEAARRGRLWWVLSGTVAPGTSVGTTAAFALANPAGSGVDLVIHKIGMGYVSGTLGAGVIMACIGAKSDTAVSGTALTSRAARGGGAGSKGAGFTTATLPASPNIYSAVWNVSAIEGTGTSALPAEATINVDGAIVIPEGCSLSLQEIGGVGTSPLVRFSACWEEVPVLQG